MLKEGLDVYVPLVDDFGIDAVIRKHDDQFIEVQIKARSTTVIDGDAALFAAIYHPKVRENYYFIFYSERLDSTWIMSSEEFVNEAVQNKTGKNVGKRSIWFNGKKRHKSTGKLVEHPYPRFEKYRVEDFSRFRNVAKLVAGDPEPTTEN
jgi:CTP:phosphocholine cytidylyltransferase-like protein